MPQTLGEIQAVLTTKGFKEFDKELSGADKKLSGFSKSLSSFGDKAIKLGGTLTKSLTLPIAALGGAALKMAADFEVSSRKFGAAFEGASEQANAAVENLNENFGIANTEATRLLANTGDLLKGFGATSEEAINLSSQVQEVAAALAAYNGVPVAQASQAVTAALLGEREQLKQLGVVIRETDVSQQLLADGKEDLTGQARLLASAEATLQLAIGQSSDAMSSFAENTDTLAFQSQKLFGDIKDLGVELGTQLLPIAKQVVESVGNLVGRFADMDEAGQKTILIMAGVAAGAGPAITAIGALSKAIAFLAANPVVAAVAAVAALTVGVGLLIKKQREARFEEQYAAAADEMKRIHENSEDVVETITEFAKQTGLTVEQSIQVAEEQGLVTDEVREQVEILRTANQEIAQNGRTIRQNLEVQELISAAIGRGAQQMFNFGDETQAAELALDAAKEQVLALSQNLDVAYGTVIEMGLANEQVTGYYREALETLKEQNQEQQAAAVAELERAVSVQRRQEEAAAAAEARAEAERQAAAELERQTEELEAQEALRIAELIENRIAAQEEYAKAVRDAQTERNLGLITERELLEQNAAAARNQIQALIDLGYTGAEDNQIGNATIREQIGLLEVLEGRITEIDEQRAQADADRAQAEADRAKADSEEAERLRNRAALEAEYTQRVFLLSADRLDVLEQEYQQALASAEEYGADVTQIEAFYASERERIQEEIDLEIENQQAAATAQRIREIQERVAAESEARDEILTFEQNYLNKIAEQNDNQIYLIEQRRRVALDAAEEIGASTLAINQYFDEQVRQLEEDSLEERAKEQKDYYKTVGKYAQNAFSALASVVADFYSTQVAWVDYWLDENIRTLDEWYNRQLEIHGLAEETAVERIQAELEEAREAGDTELVEKLERELQKAELDEEYQKEKARLEKEAAIKKWEIEKKAFIADKAFNIAQIIIDTASAIMQGFAQLGPIGGLIAMAFLTALGIAQIGIVASQPPPPKPAFAEGGVVTGPMEALVGEAGPEAILPLNDATFDALGSAIVESTAGTTSPVNAVGGMNLSIIFPGFGEAHLNLTQDALDNGQILIPASSVVRA